MKALSIRQPWAHNIIHNGKDIENRTWRTHYRGPILIHAGSRMDDGFNRYPSLQMGGIIGWCDIVDCVTESESEWFNGPYGFVLANVHPLPFIPCKGALSFFVPDIRDQVCLMHLHDKLSEGQACLVLSLGRIQFRKLFDEYCGYGAWDEK